MSRDASGTMTASGGNPVAFGTRPISSSVYNATVSDFVTEITDSLSRSGKGAMLAALNVGSFGITNAGPIAGATDITLSGSITLNGNTASTVPYLSAGKVLTSSAVTPTELSYLSGVTSALQTQLNAKLATATAASTYAPIASPTFTGNITTPLTASRALTVNASSQLAVSAVTDTELGYLSGVTSGVQAQINAKAPIASPTFTGVLTAAAGSFTSNITNTNGVIVTYGYGGNNDVSVIYMNSGATKYIQNTGTAFYFNAQPIAAGTGTSTFGSISCTGSGAFAGGATVTGTLAVTGSITATGNDTAAIQYGTSYVYSYGQIYAVGEITAYYSDMRLKDKVLPIRDALTKLRMLDTFTYQQNALANELIGVDESRHPGVSAQQVEFVLPEAVKPAPFDIDQETGKSKTGENYLTVQYERLVPLLIAGINELQDEVRALRMKVGE